MLQGLTFGSAAALEADEAAAAAERLAAARRDKKEKKEQSGKKSKHKKRKSSKKHKKAESHRATPSGSDSGTSAGGSSGGAPTRRGADGNNDGEGDANKEAGHRKGDDTELQAAVQQREDWMTTPMGRSALFQAPVAVQEDAKPAPPEDAPIVAGIRYMKPEQEEAAKAAAAARLAAAATRGRDAPGKAGGGAAGVAWRMRALQRAQQLASEQGRDLGEVLSERWGSAADIAKGLIDSVDATEPQQGRTTQDSRSREQQRDGQERDRGRRDERARHHADGRDGRDSSARASEGRSRPGADDARGSGAHYLSSVRSETAGMRRPAAASGANRLSWRRPPAASEREHERRSRDDEHHRSERKQHGGQGEHRDARHRDGGDRSHPDARDPSSREAGRERGGHGADDGPRELDSRGRREQQHVDWRSQRSQQKRDQVVAALASVAGSINQFANDGSFLQHAGGEQHTLKPVQQQEQQQEQQQQQDKQQQEDKQEEEEEQQQHEQHQTGQPDTSAAAAGSNSNHSTAAALRARLAGSGGGGGGGNKAVADALRARLGGRAPPVGAAPDGSSGGSAKREVVLLPQVDAAGRAMPGAFGREAAGDAQRAAEAAAGGRLAKRVQRYGADGKRERYFADDDGVDLQTLVKRTKHGDDAMNIDATLASNIAARSRFKETDLDVDAEYDYDAGLEMTESRRRRGDAEQQRARERQRQVSQFNRMQRAEDRCTLCFSSGARPRSLTLAVGQSTYLSLVQRGRLADGHCVIATAEHVASMRQADDAAWTEVRNFQKCLIRMFMEAGQEVLFMETAVGLGTHRHHAVLEAIPLDPDAAGRAPMYFKKALQEAESEWSTHAAKSVIDTKAKGLRGSIPPHFPYMYVQFGYSAGFVHVVDDENRFDRELGRQVVAGLLRLPPEVAARRARPEPPAAQAAAAADFRKRFAPYDWTRALEGGS